MTLITNILLAPDTHANRPAASTAGRIYYETDTQALFRDSGSSWVAYSPGSTFSGEITGTDISLTGLTGATAGFKIIGAVASGAPASGTHAANDIALDIAGKQWYICTAGGTPGTWAAMGGGGGSSTLAGDTDVSITSPADGQALIYVNSASKWENSYPPGHELGYAEITTSFTTSSTTYVDVTGLTLTVTVPSGGVMLEFWCEAVDSLTTNGARGFVSIYDTTAAAMVAEGAEINYGTDGGSLSVRKRHIPGAGSRSYKIQMKVDASAGTGRMVAVSASPAFLRIVAI